MCVCVCVCACVPRGQASLTEVADYVWRKRNNKKIGIIIEIPKQEDSFIHQPKDNAREPMKSKKKQRQLEKEGPVRGGICLLSTTLR